MNRLYYLWVGLCVSCFNVRGSLFQGPEASKVFNWLDHVAVPIIMSGRQELNQAVASVIRAIKTLAGRDSLRVGGPGFACCQPIWWSLELSFTEYVWHRCRGY